MRGFPPEIGRRIVAPEARESGVLGQFTKGLRVPENLITFP
jgi:hypothetical protein